MRIHQLHGQQGENLAAQYLEEKGYQIHGRNVRAGRSEFDIIALYEGKLIFVEVKTRKNDLFGFPESFVSKSKENAMIRGAELFLESCGHQGEIRFDIIAVTLNPRLEIQHFEDAFWHRT